MGGQIENPNRQFAPLLGVLVVILVGIWGFDRFAGVARACDVHTLNDALWGKVACVLSQLVSH